MDPNLKMHENNFLKIGEFYDSKKNLILEYEF